MQKTLPTIALWSCLVLVLGLAGEVSAQEVTLRYGHVQGSLLAYDLQLDTPSLQASQKIDVEVLRQVTSVDAQGVMEIESTFQNGTMTINGVSYPLPVQGQIMTATMTPRGEAIATQATGQLGALFAQAGVSTDSSAADVFRSLGILEFPEDPVSAGSTWSVLKSHDFPNGDALEIAYQYTLDGFEEVAGYQCARIAIEAQPAMSFLQDFPSLRQSMQINGGIAIAGTLWFAHAEGRIVKLVETIETNAVALIVHYDGMTDAVPMYQKTSVNLDLQ